MQSYDDRSITINHPTDSLDAEQCVLGGLLLDNAALNRVVGIVGEADFYGADHRLIFRHICKLVEKRQPADAVTVSESLEQAGELAKVGGLAYLNKIASDTPSAANIQRYAEIVRDHVQKRGVAALLSEGLASTKREDWRKVLQSIPPRMSALLVERGKEKKSDPSTWPAPPLDWTRLSRLQVPKRTWFHEDWLGPIPTLLAGAPGAGKTLLGQQWCTCLALGLPFMAPFVFERPLVVLMWACEDEGDELWRRQVDVCEWAGIDDLTSLKGKFHLVSRFGKDNTLLASVFGALALTRIYTELREEVNDVRADVLILDNTAQAFGGNENARHDPTMFSNSMAGLVTGRPFCPVMLGHTPKNGAEYSGNTAWEASVRMRLYFGNTLPDADPTDLPDDNVRFLCRRKANYSHKDYRRFTYTNGVYVPDGAESTAEIGMVGVIRRQNAEKAVIKALGWLAERRLYASHAKQSNKYLPSLMAEHDLLNGQTKREATDGMNRLIGDKRVLVDQPVGFNAQRHQVLGLLVASA